MAFSAPLKQDCILYLFTSLRKLQQRKEQVEGHHIWSDIHFIWTMFFLTSKEKKHKNKRGRQQWNLDAQRYISEVPSDT